MSVEREGSGTSGGSAESQGSASESSAPGRSEETERSSVEMSDDKETEVSTSSSTLRTGMTSHLPDVVWLHGRQYFRDDLPLQPQTPAKERAAQGLHHRLAKARQGAQGKGEARGGGWEGLAEFLHKERGLKGSEAAVAQLLLGGSEGGAREALLRAVDEGAVDLVGEVLDLMEREKWDGTLGASASDAFPPHLTPLVLAAVNNHLPVTQLLLLRGHRIPVPHLAPCTCPECLPLKKSGESWESIAARLDTFRALTSPAHLLLSSHDPFLLAIDLRSDLRKCADAETQLQEVYEGLGCRIEETLAALASELRSDQELRLLLGRKEGIHLPSAETRLPRLRIALDGGLSSFLAEDRVQTGLWKEWAGEWRDWDQVGPMRKAARLLTHTLLVFPAALVFLCSGGHWPSSFQSPMARFLSSASAFVFFLAALVGVAVSRPNVERLGLPEESWQTALLLWAFLYQGGSMATGGLRMFRYGIRRFLASTVNWLDIITWFFFIVAGLFWFRALWESERSGLAPDRPFTRVHWLNYAQSQLVFELVLAYSLVFSGFKFFYYLQLSRFLGPTIISTARCMKDILLYVGLVMAVMGSFGLALHWLFKPYAPTTPTKGPQVPGPFYQFGDSVVNLFWAFFGYLQPYDVHLRYGEKSARAEGWVGNVGLEDRPVVHGLVFAATKAIVVVYHIFIIIVMLNIMVALLVKSASDVLVREENEWKVNRVVMWAEAMEDEYAVPPPLNILYWLMSWVPYLSSKRRRFQLSPPNLFYLQPKRDRVGVTAYQSLLLSLFYRLEASKTGQLAPLSAQAPAPASDVLGPQTLARLLRQRFLQPSHQPSHPKAK